MTIQIIKPGMQTTVQDLGRPGFQSYGISVGGVMDPWSAKIANILLNNQESEAVLEMTYQGPTLEIQKDLILAIYGADMDATCNGKKLSIGKPTFMQKGDLLKFGYAKDGTSSYLAVKGGFLLNKSLSSYSTDIRAQIGGINGRALQAGDLLATKDTNIAPMMNQEFRYYLDNTYIKEESATIHFIKGRQYDWFTKESLRLFQEKPYTIEPNSDRMGYRLSGRPIEQEGSQQLITEGTTFGSIQVPQNGQPIILMADRQPTGGYPKVGEVIRSDHARLSQMRPGQKICFQEVSLETAYQKYHQQLNVLMRIKQACQLKWKELS